MILSVVYCTDSPLTPLYLTDIEGIALNIGFSLTPSLPFFGREGAGGELFLKKNLKILNFPNPIFV
jgi:hypothetical protein